MIFRLFKAFRKSVSKSKSLKSASQKLAAAAQPTFDLQMMMNQKGIEEEGWQELLTLINNDQGLRAIAAKYSVSAKELKDIYRALIVNGAGRWAKGHWVAASALAFGMTLDHTLRQYRTSWTQDDCLEVAYDISEYFEKVKTGQVESNRRR